MKRLFKLLPLAVLALAVSCDLLQSSTSPDTPGTTSPSDGDATLERIDDSHVKVGSIDYWIEGELSLDEDGEPAFTERAYEKVSFSAFPNTAAEISVLQKEFLGKRYGGVVAMHIMAIEMYRRNRDEGTAALRLVNESSNMTAMLDIFSQRFPLQRGAQSTDTYQQPYFVAALLDGSTIENHYTPTEPYSVTVKWYGGENNHTEGLGITTWGDFYEVTVSPGGYAKAASPERRLTVHSDPEGNPYLTIFNCSSITTQVATIRSWTDNLK
ncbi:MAG: hypothetical protein IJ795_04995 [Bacteroidales bacterium]|nr:hypothetical protein [Bacteroidales bacterium]